MITVSIKGKSSLGNDATKVRMLSVVLVFHSMEGILALLVGNVQIEEYLLNMFLIAYLISL